MKEFSKLIPEDRTFEIGGEVYTWVTPYWEDLAAIFDEDVAMIAQAALDAAAATSEDETAAAAAAQQAAEKAQNEKATKDNTARVQTRIMLFLDESEHARWKALCKRKKPNPVPMFLFNELYRWLLEVATGRPTTPSSDSAPGDGNGVPSSQVGSPSRAARRRR